MKKLILCIFASLLLTVSVQASDITVGSSVVPGFYASSLPTDVTLTNVSVSFNSANVSCASCFRSSWVGLGGFRITINGVAHAVRYVTSTSSLTLTSNYIGSTSSSATVLWYKYVELRVYADSSFRPLGKSYIAQPGAIGSGAWHRRVAASVVNELGTNNLYIPEITIDATTDSPTNQAARYTAVFYRPDGSQIQIYDCFDSFALPPVTPTTWPDICTFNYQQVVVQDNYTYTKTQVDAMRTGCSLGQGLYYAETGLKPSCLIFGTGLTLTGNTLSSAGNVISTILEEGNPLTQRAFLNFVGSAFTATDNAGIPSTDVVSDADLNAIASNSTNGFYSRTGNGSIAARTHTGTSNRITITNGDGVSGNPVYDIGSDVVTLAGIQTLTNKTLTSPVINTPTITGGTHSGGTHTGITSLGIRSTGSGAFDLTLANSENLTAGRALTLAVNDANRTLSLGGNLTTAGAFTTSGANALTLTTSGSTNVTLPTTGTLSTLAGTETLTNKTLTSPTITSPTISGTITGTLNASGPVLVGSSNSAASNQLLGVADGSTTFASNYVSQSKATVDGRSALLLDVNTTTATNNLLDARRAGTSVTTINGNGRVTFNASQSSSNNATLSTASIVPSGMLSTFIPDTVSNSGSSETTLGTYSVLANTLATNGDSLAVEIFGSYAANGNTKTIRVKFAGSTIYTQARSLNDGKWSISLTGARVNSTFFRFRVLYTDQQGATNAVNLLVDVLSSVTYSNANTFEVTGQGTSSADLSANFGTIEKKSFH